MSCTAIVRGNTVEFTAQFYAPDGTTITPASANVVIAYNHATVPTVDTVAMTDSLNVWSASWDSSVADAGTVYWHVQSSGPPAAAGDGSFTISANLANVES